MSTWIDYVKSDLYRYEKKTTLKSFVKTYVLRGGFKYLFWVRVNSALYKNKKMRYILFPLTWIMWRRYTYKYGISIPYTTKIGYGLKINHFGGIVVNSNSIIGNNVTICHGVTIGNNEIGHTLACPTIKDKVYVAPGAKIIGDITVNESVVIGVNSVVVKDISPRVIVGGIPAKVLREIVSGELVKNEYLLESI
ncbi:serine acetyltransferase [Paenibacillus sp. HB172176]|uniref:serine O-acetyltransferase n=1 Tax=Paenibacillus sp. HB172176 TaxID=2493690 RepID=UPI00143BECB5|nr:serine acetyltransferase [Paenibacillus sp. HB172176]